MSERRGLTTRSSGSVRALQRLGRGFLCEPANKCLRDYLSADASPALTFHRQLIVFLLRMLAERSASASRLHLPTPLLDSCKLSEDVLLEALSELRRTAWSDDDPLGQVYQESLAVEPVLDLSARQYQVHAASGLRRKLSGSYYTPAVLADALLLTALDPLLDRAVAASDPEAAILDLHVCDPACGSGSLLLSAARRMADRLVAVRSHKGLAADRGQAIVDIVTRCLYGVDRDPLVVDLCRFNLWMMSGRVEADWGFLKTRIRCGNSLVGAPPGFIGDDPDAWTAEHLCSNGNQALEDIAPLRIFHWHHAFADVLRDRFGFDLVLANPPWERLKVQEREWFAVRCPEVADCPDAAARRRAIQDLATSRPALYNAFLAGREQARREVRFLCHSGRFPMSGRGDVNAYAPFVELSLQLLRPGGRAGLIVPSGIATDNTLKDLFDRLVENGAVASWLDFHNRRQLFPDVQGNVKFCLLTLTGERQKTFIAAAQLDHPDRLAEPGRTYTLSSDQICKINPNTRHAPLFASAQDAELVARLHARFPVLVRESAKPANPWNVLPATMFHMTKDAGLFRTREALEAEGWTLNGSSFVKEGSCWLPLWEAKLAHAYNHRAATFAGVPPGVRFRLHAGARATAVEQLADPTFVALPRFWVNEPAIDQRWRTSTWHLGFRNAISAVADSRSLVAAVLPAVAVSNGLPLIRGLSATRACLLLALLNSFALDYILRQKAGGGNLNFYILRQLPVPPPEVFTAACPWSHDETLADWFRARVLELTYTTEDLRPFALECGWDGPPFRWDVERRSIVRAEIDAACFHVYGLSRDETAHVLDTFAVLARREQKQFGRVRSRELVLERYDNLAGNIVAWLTAAPECRGE